MIAFLKKVLIGGLLIIGIVKEGCFAGELPISGQLQLDSSILTYTMQLEKHNSSAEHLLKILCNTDKRKKIQEISFTISDRSWMSNSALCGKFLEEVIQKISEPGILFALPDVLEQLSAQMDELDKRDERHYEVCEEQVEQIETSTLPLQSYLSTLTRFSSQNSLIRCLSKNIVALVKSPSDMSLRSRIINSVKKLLSDPEPNKAWILLQINGLQTHGVTKEFYQELETIIER